MKRKTRILAAIFGLLLYPTISYALIPTTDIKGTLASIRETIQSVATWLETTLQLQQIQETMSTVGTAVNGVVTYINNVKENIQKRLEKLEKYKEKYEEYKAEYEAYKAEYEAYKELYNEYKEDYETYKSKVESAVDSVQSAVDDVKSAASAVTAVVQNADAIIDSQVDKVKDKVGLSSDSSSSSTSSASSSVSGSDSGELNETGASESVNLGSVSNNDTSYSNGTTDAGSDSSNSGTSGGTANGTAAQDGLVDISVQTPSRKPITSDEAPLEDVLENTADTNGEATANETSVDNAPADVNNQNQNVSNEINEENQTGDVVDTTGANSGSDNSGVSGGTVNDTGTNTTATQTGLVNIDVQTPLRRSIIQTDSVSTEVGDQNQDSPEDTNAENQTENSNLSISTTGITALPQESIDMTPVPLTNNLVNSGVELQETLSPEDSSDTELQNDSQPTRQPFSVSYGYGHLSSSFALANASLGLPDLKTGETPEGVMIIPNALTRACNNKGYKIDYKTVADREDETFDKCLVAMNAERKSSDVSQEMRESAAKIMNDAYAEYLASSYLTALNVYNESLTFKKKKVAPILKTHLSNTRDAWTNVKEMNELMGTRLNQWSILTTHLVLQEMFEPYATWGLTDTTTDTADE